MSDTVTFECVECTSGSFTHDALDFGCLRARGKTTHKALADNFGINCWYGEDVSTHRTLPVTLVITHEYNTRRVNHCMRVIACFRVVPV